MYPNDLFLTLQQKVSVVSSRLEDLLWDLVNLTLHKRCFVYFKVIWFKINQSAHVTREEIIKSDLLPSHPESHRFQMIRVRTATQKPPLQGTLAAR